MKRRAALALTVLGGVMILVGLYFIAAWAVLVAVGVAVAGYGLLGVDVDEE